MKQSDEKKLRQKQAFMHKEAFDRVKFAIENRFYLEAIFMEYAAIEGRLEIMLGILEQPCNKNADSSKRRKVNISTRIKCLNFARKNLHDIFTRTKLDKDFFSDKSFLKNWIKDRNVFVHALYKNADEYSNRKNIIEKIAIQGADYMRLIYNEVNRLKRLRNSHPELFDYTNCFCRIEKCALSEKKRKEL